MKRLLLLTLALALPLTQVVRAENNEDNKKRKRRAAAKTTQAAVAQPAQTNQTVKQQVRGGVAPTQRQAIRSEANLNAPDVRRSRTVAVAGNRPRRDVNHNSFVVARTRVIRVPHDRFWWTNHFNTFVLFGGGYWYWDAGYWYPAYGYNPYYNTYGYGEPIYGYNNLAPGQVIEKVQVALRNQGYYRGAIDGLVGSQTRSALSRYQHDHGLMVTAAIDEPTLVTLGLA